MAVCVSTLKIFHKADKFAVAVVVSVARPNTAAVEVHVARAAALAGLVLFLSLPCQRENYSAERTRRTDLP